MVKYSTGKEYITFFKIFIFYLSEWPVLMGGYSVTVAYRWCRPSYTTVLNYELLYL